MAYCSKKQTHPDQWYFNNLIESFPKLYNCKQIDKAAFKWFTVQRSQNIRIDGTLIKKSAKFCCKLNMVIIFIWCIKTTYNVFSMIKHWNYIFCFFKISTIDFDKLRTQGICLPSPSLR